MSSSHRKRPKHTSRSGSNSSQFPSAWSDWELDKNQDRYQRYRLKGPDQYQYDYRRPENPIAQQAIPRDPNSFESAPIESGNYQKSNLYTSQPPALDRSLAALSLRSDNVASFSASLVRPWSAHVTTRDPSTDREEFDPHYKVQKASQFKTGKIFKVLWSEPRGNNTGNYGTQNTTAASQGSSDSITVRSGKHGAIHEKYGGQGVNKHGVHADHHAVIYSNEYPIYLPGEGLKITKQPLKVEPSSPRHKLDEASRLNYAKPYTVEYNVKVWFIGKVIDESYWQLAADYNLVHPPLQTSPTPVTFHRDQTPQHTYSHATGGSRSGATRSWDKSSYASRDPSASDLFPTSTTLDNDQLQPMQSSSTGATSGPSQWTGIQYSTSHDSSGRSQWKEAPSSPSNTASTPVPIASSHLGSPRYLEYEDELSPLPADYGSSGSRSRYLPTGEAIQPEDVSLGSYYSPPRVVRQDEDFSKRESPTTTYQQEHRAEYSRAASIPSAEEYGYTNSNANSSDPAAQQYYEEEDSVENHQQHPGDGTADHGSDEEETDRH